MSAVHPPLLPYEVEILKSINAWHSPVADAFMYMISNPGAWVPLVAVLLYVLFARKPWQEGGLFLLAVALCILVCDGLSSSFAKPFFARPRPTHYEGLSDSLNVVYGYRGRMYGFFSGHASNFTAVAVVLIRLIGKRWHSILIGSIVALVIYSRLYLGVHFISDTLAGIVVGACVGYVVSWLQQGARRRFSPLGSQASSDIFEPQLGIWGITLGLFLLALLSYSWQVARIISMVSTI